MSGNTERQPPHSKRMVAPPGEANDDLWPIVKFKFAKHLGYGRLFEE
ncbi:MAG: hypothetical protein KC592_01030 [Nitrospira sp.]|nr:hypothetical protein [Nitrospira sp.]